MQREDGSARRRGTAAFEQGCWDLYHFFRVSAFGATATLPLLGAGSADPQLPLRRAGGLLAVATAFHSFAYLHNDVCDLALDRTQPRRQRYPLVRGAVAPPVALGLALACLPLAFVLHAWLVAPAPPGGRGAPARPAAPAHLATACALLAIYNRYGKICPVPMLTDLVQALGWAALLRYGAAATGRAATGLTALLAAYEVLLILLVNGVHGALRDLENDAARGARTTAIVLGARVEQGALRVSRPLLIYALLLQAGLLALPAWGVAANTAAQRGPARIAAGTGVAGISLATLATLAAVARAGHASDGAGMAHLVLLLSSPVALVAPGLAACPRSALLAAHLAPLIPNGMTYAALRWATGLERRQAP